MRPWLSSAYPLAETDFTPYAPKSTADATQMGWHKSAGNFSYTVFYWPKQGVYSVHGEDLEPVTVQTFTSKQAAVDYIATLDQGYVEPVKKLTPAYAFSRSIDGSNGVDEWLGDGCVLKHNGDWIRFYWPITDQGAEYFVTYEYEKGDISSLPQDFSFVLLPGERRTLYNTETSKVYYNVRVRYTGAVELAPVNGAVDGDVNGEVNGTVMAASRTYIFNGPFMTRVRAMLGR